jgi:hypothetical protein
MLTQIGIIQLTPQTLQHRFHFAAWSLQHR